MTKIISRICIALTTSLLTSCMMGPDFHSPKAPDTTTYTGSPLKHQTVSSKGHAGQSQKFETADDIPEEWWTLFHSHELNDLIEKGIANSPNLEAAKAALSSAHEAVVAEIGSTLLPNVNAQLGAQRERFPSAEFGSSGISSTSIFNVFNATVNVSYTPDFFGSARRQIEDLRAEEDATRYELAAAYLTLTTNIATTSFAIASYRAQVQATQDLIRIETNELNIMEQQYKLGGSPLTDVLTQRTQLAQTRATLPPLLQSLAQNQHLLSILIGEIPDENSLPKFNFEKINLPTHLPVTVPSSLVRQRPDILTAEATMHAACAEVGVATANLYPQITLSGNYGWEALTASHLVNPKNVTWDFGAALLQPIFNGGALMAKKRGAVDTLKQTAAQYKQTVLQGFQNVADTLRALEHDAETLKAQTDGKNSAYHSLILTQQQYKLGGVNFLSLLTAENQYQQTRIGYIQAKAARFADTAALFQALGGGWWHVNLEKDSAHG